MIKLVTYLTPILMVSGLAKNYFYYRSFNVRILDYIELSETLTIITEASIFILILIPFTWFASFMLDLKKEHVTETEKKKDLIQIAHGNDKFFRRLKIYLLNYWGASLMIVVFFITTLILRFASIEKGWGIELMFYTLFTTIISLVLILEFRYKYKRIFEKELDYRLGTILHYGTLFFLLMTFYTIFETKGIKNGTLNLKEYSIELSTGEKIHTSKELVAIGQTRHYFFLYHRENGETTVIAKKLVDKLVIK